MRRRPSRRPPSPCRTCSSLLLVVGGAPPCAASFCFEPADGRGVSRPLPLPRPSALPSPNRTARLATAPVGRARSVAVSATNDAPSRPAVACPCATSPPRVALVLVLSSSLARTPSAPAAGIAIAESHHCWIVASGSPPYRPTRRVARCPMAFRSATRRAHRRPAAAMHSSRLSSSIPPSLDSDSDELVLASRSARLPAPLGTCQAGCPCSESEASYAAGDQHVATSCPEMRRPLSLGRLGRRSIVPIIAANVGLSRRRRSLRLAAERDAHSPSLSSSSSSSDASDACFGEPAAGLLVAAAGPA